MPGWFKTLEWNDLFGILGNQCDKSFGVHPSTAILNNGQDFA